MANIAEQQAVVKSEDLDGLSPSNLKKLSLIIAALALGLVSAEAVLAAATAGTPDAVFNEMPYDQYLACYQYWDGVAVTE